MTLTDDRKKLLSCSELENPIGIETYISSDTVAAAAYVAANLKTR